MSSVRQPIDATLGYREFAGGLQAVGRTLGDPLKRALYFFYERSLLRQVKQQPVPRHVGIILDGNRRYCHGLGINDPRSIYRLGADKLDDVLDWCAELKIPIVTLWVFSPDNLRRGPEEISGIFAAIESKLATLVEDPQIHSRRVRVRAIGDLALVPQRTLDVVRRIEQATVAYDAMDLNIAVAYGGRREIVDAVRGALAAMATQDVSLAEAVQRLTPSS